MDSMLSTKFSDMFKHLQMCEFVTIKALVKPHYCVGLIEWVAIEWVGMAPLGPVV